MSTNANHTNESIPSESIPQLVATAVGTSICAEGDPQKQLEEFFQNYHLKEVWEYLEHWFEAGITNETAYQSGTSRSNLIHFKKSMWSLAVAAFQLYSAEQQPPSGQ
jgi:hypothetical protein